jgi:hypothetical protein
MIDYQDFLDAKAQLGTFDGFDPGELPSFLFDFQASLVEWAIRKGKAALLADCGLGKGAMELAWADAVVRHTNKPVLLMAPLAVSAEFVREGEKFGIEIVRSQDGSLPRGATIVTTNYERLDKFNPDDFAGAVCDEASILKNFDGVRRGQITEFLRRMPHRLLASATAAPNDHVELGTLSEALGELGYMDMLSRFFKNDSNTTAARHYARGEIGVAQAQWRFRGHAEEIFWPWVASWARALRRPSDLGFDDGKFVLPPLEEVEHLVSAAEPAEGMLLSLPAVGLQEQREERRRTLVERCEMAASLVADTGQPAVMWCHLNTEGDLLERLVPGAIQVSGSDSDEAKEEGLLAFAAGEARVMVTKAKIAGWGLNWQHCAHTTVFPSHSFEQYYQSIRRFWRFGQTNPVRVDVISTDGDRGVKDNLRRKGAAADRQFTELVTHMNRAIRLDRARTFSTPEELPSWL